MRTGLINGILTAILMSSMACIDNSAKHINNSVYFNPSYSLPIGPAAITAGKIFNSNHFQKVDTSAIDDTVGFFLYDSAFYDAKPGYVDTTISKYFDFSTLSDKLDVTKSLMIRLNVINGFPTTILVQLYFENGNQQTLDSLVISGPLKIESANSNSEGIVTSPFILNNYDTYLDRSEIEMLKQVRVLRLFVRVETINPDVPFIKLYPDYRIDLDLALRIELDMNLGDI
jgi:hypothetical protein